MAVYDPSTQQVLYRSYGTLSYPTTISYERDGLRIVIGDIEDFAVGTTSDFISVTLERKVPYEVQLTPSATGFTFLPPIITFTTSTDQTQYFRIQPNDDTVPDTYYI
mmetsp:Transcript_13854/g.11833  ORF Transcript_13854/g.11833 Transcript_13854/m.11833 type:complete len:107 (+) Transcript_13854:8185-8505(+)